MIKGESGGIYTLQVVFPLLQDTVLQVADDLRAFHHDSECAFKSDDEDDKCQLWSHGGRRGRGVRMEPNPRRS